MKRKYLILLAVIGVIAVGILISAMIGILPASDVPYAFGVLALCSALLFGYVTLRVRDEY